MTIKEIEQIDFYDWCGIDGVFLDTRDKKIEYLKSKGIKINP